MDPYRDLAPTPKNPEYLTRLVRVKVKKSFYIGGKPCPVDSVVSIQRHLALDLQALGRCEILES
jgi:hypothetical protein